MRINLGCGYVQPEGWINLDSDPSVYDVEGSDAHYANPLVERLPWIDDVADAVVANHVLQMVGYYDQPRWLGEVRRVLKPGGVLRLLVPDMLRALAAYKCDNAKWFPLPDELAPTVADKLCLYLTQGGASKSIFLPGHLTDSLMRAGYDRVAVVEPHLTKFGEDWITDLDSREDESLVVEAVK